MFYCEKCKDENGWQGSIGTSWGKCEVCGDIDTCHDTPSSQLPLPPKQHTPGDWEYTKRVKEDFSLETYLITANNGETLVAHTGSGDNARENAILIKAAPNMLEALKEMVRMYEDVQPAGGWQGAYETAQMVINQATKKD